LGEFSLIGRLFTLGSFMKNTKVVQILGYFSRGKISAKNKIWAIFSPTRLVTLITATARIPTVGRMP
jgi:hypothetical protein